jgi:5-oxopent-3-ene-1,2,5-tricarboxylate decarboxylase/2-hydroxyhepta-2,4-diene-1,7-dioate isomerase
VLGLARIEVDGAPVIAVYDGVADRVAPLTHQPASWTAALALLTLSSGRSGLDDAGPALSDEAWIDAADATFLPPVTAESRVFCVAQNYTAHAMESSGSDSPPEPVMFLKPNSALVGHGRPTVLSPATSFFDWEAELGVVVGADLAGASTEQARAGIQGYTIANDGTARDLQPIELGNRQIVDWFSAKGIDDSSVLGPAIFPAGLVDDEGSLHLHLERNGETMQDDAAGLMNVKPDALLAHISRIIALHPGDVLLTGTPAGVGKARGVSLADGDELVISIAPLGTLRTRIEAP